MLAQDQAVGDYTGSSDCSPKERERIVETLIELHDAKKYKVSTFYCAVGLCDRFLRKKADALQYGR